MSDTSDGTQNSTDSNKIELTPSAMHANNPFLLPSNTGILLPFSSDLSQQDLLKGAPPVDNSPLVIASINCKDEDSTSQSVPFPDVDLLCLESPTKYTKTAAALNQELLLQFDDLLAPSRAPEHPRMEFTSQPVTDTPLTASTPLSGQNKTSNDPLPNTSEQSDSGGSGDSFGTPPNTPSWNTEASLDSNAENPPLTPVNTTSPLPIKDAAITAPASRDDVIPLTPKESDPATQSHSSLPVLPQTEPQVSPQFSYLPPPSPAPSGSMLAIHGMDESVSIERLKLYLWLYRASILLVEIHPDPADPALRLGVVKFSSSQLADQLQREFSQLPICGHTHKITATVCQLPVAPQLPSDRDRDSGDYFDDPCSVMEGAPVSRQRKMRPVSPASREFSPDTGMRLDPNRVSRDSGNHAPAKFQRMDPKLQPEEQPRIHSIMITNISNIEHPEAKRMIRSFVTNWWDNQIQSIIVSDDHMRPNCSIMYINTFHKNLPELILQKLREHALLFHPLEANIRWNSAWTGHRNMQKRPQDTSPCQDNSHPNPSYPQEMEVDTFSHSSAPPLSPPEQSPPPCVPLGEEKALLMHKVNPPVDTDSMSYYFREFITYTVSWESTSLEGNLKCVRVVFSNGEVAAEAKLRLEHIPFNGAYVVFSIGTSREIEQQQQQQQGSSPLHRSTPDDAYLIVTGFDEFITTDYFEAHSVIKRYAEHYSDIRIQTNKETKKKRIRIKFHNRDAVIAAEAAMLQVKIRDLMLDAFIEQIRSAESPLTPVKPTSPIIVVSSIPPGVTPADIGFLFKSFGSIMKEIDIKPMGPKTTLGQCKVVFESAESASRAVKEKHGITYRGHILDVKFLSDLIQPVTGPPVPSVPIPTVEPESESETRRPTPRKEASVEGAMSKELFLYFTKKFKTEIERFKQLGLGQLNHNGNTLTLKHSDGTVLDQFIDDYINETSESDVRLSDDDLKLLSSQTQNSQSNNMEKLVGAFKETGHIDYIVGHFPSSFHVFGHKKTVDVVMKNIMTFLCSHLEIQCPLNLFFNKFPEILYSDLTKFDFKEMRILINSPSLDECKLIRKHMNDVITSCCTCEIKMTQKFLKPAHIFITRNGLQVCLLIKTPEGKYLDQASKSIEGAVVCLCGMKEHVDSLVKVLESPIEEAMTISQNALEKLTKKRDKGSILLEKFEAKSKVCILLEKKNNAVIISGFIKEDVKAMVGELGKKLEDVRVVIPDSCLKKIQRFYLIAGQTQDPNAVAEIIQDLEVQLQLKVEFQNQNIQLSGDQESILSFESNTQEVEKFFSCRIPQRFFHKVVQDANGDQFAKLIFRYLGYLSKQDTLFIFEVMRPQPMVNRVGSSDIQIVAAAHPQAMAVIEQKIKVIRPRSDTVKATKEDFLLFHSAVDKFGVIKENEFVEILPNPKSNSLEFLSLGVSAKSAQDLFASGISDQDDRRNLTITAHLAFYIRRKGIIDQLTAKFDCNLKLEERGNSFTCCVQMDGKRDAIEKVIDHLNALKNGLICKPFELKYPSKKFLAQFHTEVIIIIDLIQEKFKVIIDARKLSVRGESDKDCELTVISEFKSDVDQATAQLKDCLIFEKSTHPLTPLQHARLLEDMLPKLNKQSFEKRYYINLSHECLVIMALKYFAKQALPAGDLDLQVYIKFSCSDFRVQNLPTFHALMGPPSIQKIDAIGKNNLVKIIPPQTLTECYRLEGNHDNVRAAHNEMEKYVQELSKLFGTCKIPVTCPIEALRSDNDICGFLDSLSHPDTSILVTLPQQDSKLMGQQLIASYEIPLNTHNLILEIRKGDITKLKVDAIVNAANEHLSHGGGVANAISIAGGPIVQQSSDQFIRQNGPLRVSTNVILPPGNIQCKSIIHAVGPVWNETNAEQVKNELGHCILNICATANGASYSSIALPAISAGIFAFPLQMSTSIIIEAIKRFFTSQPFYSLKQLILIDILDNTLQQFKTICDACFKPTAPAPVPRAKTIPNRPPPPKPPKPPQPQVTFQWQENDGTWKPYSDESVQILRQAYTNNPNGTVRISRSKYTYIVDFTSMIQSNDQTAVQRNVRVDNSSLQTGDPAPAPLAQPPSEWKDISSETVTFYGRKDRLSDARDKFEDLTKQLMKKTEFDVTHISKNDLIPIMSACKGSFVKLALDEQNAALKVRIEGYYKEVKATETEIRANLMKLMQEQTPNLDGPPSHWDPHGPDEICKLVLIQPPSTEYSDVVNNFRSTMPKASLLSVQRIQNTWLWTRYQQDKQRTIQKSETGANEMMVYHGTRSNPPVQIYKGEQGFEARVASSGMWGTASYFAVNASYSDSYAYQCPEDGTRQIFSVKICAGDVIDMSPDKSLRLPPLKSAATAQPQTLNSSLLQYQAQLFQLPQQTVPSLIPVPAASSQAAPLFVNDRYDTVSGQTAGSKVYMIYENGRAYPEYLITYR